MNQMFNDRLYCGKLPAYLIDLFFLCLSYFLNLKIQLEVNNLKPLKSQYY